MGTGFFPSEDSAPSGAPAATQLDDEDPFFLAAATPLPLPESRGSSRQPPPSTGPDPGLEEFPMPTEMIPAAGFAHAWNALFLNRGHHVWGHREHISPIVSGLLFMVNNRATLNSSVMKALAEAVSANDYLGPILRHLSASSARWPPALRNLAKLNKPFPK